MTSTSVTIYEAKTHLSRLIAEVEKTGRPIVICRGRKPVAELTRRMRREPQKRDPKLREVIFFCDPSEPLTADLNNLRIVTRDTVIPTYPGVRTVWG